jgi:hypothetical protein
MKRSKHPHYVLIPHTLFEDEHKRVSQQSKQKTEARKEKRRQYNPIRYKKKLLLEMTNTPQPPSFSVSLLLPNAPAPLTMPRYSQLQRSGL